jgi:hypothetical protein
MWIITVDNGTPSTKMVLWSVDPARHLARATAC